MSDKNEVDIRDFLDRADILCALGKNVLISTYGEYYRLAQYLFQYTQRPIALAMGLVGVVGYAYETSSRAAISMAARAVANENLT